MSTGRSITTDLLTPSDTERAPTSLAATWMIWVGASPSGISAARAIMCAAPNASIAPMTAAVRNLLPAAITDSSARISAGHRRHRAHAEPHRVDRRRDLGALGFALRAGIR